jgi:hypothetical protein
VTKSDVLHAGTLQDGRFLHRHDIDGVRRAHPGAMVQWSDSQASVWMPMELIVTTNKEAA